MPARVALFDSATTVTWSDGSNFNGFALIGIIPPIDGTSWVEVDTGDEIPVRQALPFFARIPITNGKFNTSCGLFFNADLAPPNSTYNLRYYDRTGRLVAGPSSPFTVSSSPVSLPFLTLTVPSSGGTAPTPD